MTYKGYQGIVQFDEDAGFFKAGRSMNRPMRFTIPWTTTWNSARNLAANRRSRFRATVAEKLEAELKAS